MKKTISIHLMGTNFLVEEDAYELVHNYLERLKKSFQNSKDQQEIVDDVELRIAELATNLITDKKQVVTYAEMKQILDTLGQPEEFVEEEATDAGSFTETTSLKSTKKLFRDPENGTFAGVCSGLSSYFGIDVIWIRIIFLLLFFAGGFIIPMYFILWIIVPAAKTNAERLQMQGKPVNLENLKEELNETAQKIKKSTKQFEREIKDKAGNFKYALNNMADVIRKIAGVFMWIFGTIMLISLLGLLFFNESVNINNNNSMNFSEFRSIVLTDSSNDFYFVLGGILIIIPAIIFLYLWGTVCFFSIKSKWIKGTFLTLLLLGISGATICFFQAIRLGNDFTVSRNYNQKIGEVSDSVLVLNIQKTEDFNLENQVSSKDQLFGFDNSKIYKSEIDVDYGLSADSNFHIYAIYSAKGKNSQVAYQRSRGIFANLKINGNQLIVDPIFSFNKTDKFRFQELEIKVLIPQGKKVITENHIIHSNEIEASGYINKNGDYHHDSDF